MAVPLYETAKLISCNQNHLVQKILILLLPDVAGFFHLYPVLHRPLTNIRYTQ